MIKIISICNQKGGVGKTTTAINIGAGINRQGYRVLFIDLDPQCNLTYTLGSQITHSILDVITGETSLEDAIQSIEQGHLIASNQQLANADNILVGPGREYKLKEVLESLKLDVDYIIIDTPPALSTLSVNALATSTDLIIPAQADIFSLQGIGQLIQTINAVKKYCNPDLNILGLLLTRYNSRTIISKDIKDLLDDTAEAIDTRVFKTAIRECTALKEAQAKKTDIFSYKPNSNASKDYLDLIKEMLEDEEDK